MKGEGTKEEAGRWYNSVAALWFVVLNCGAVDGWLVGTLWPYFPIFVQKLSIIFSSKISPNMNQNIHFNLTQVLVSTDYYEETPFICVLNHISLI